MSRHAIKVIFSGLVQGVGFRYRSNAIAQTLPVSGYVRNLPDGTVELVAEGSEDDLNLLIRNISEELKTNIQNIEQESIEVTGFDGFKIAH